MGTIIGTIITGAIIGAIARFFMRGRQNISILWTIVCGAIGAAVGNWAAVQLGVAATAGIDWMRWILSVFAAMLTISLYLGMTGRK
ncbi:MAG: GlsB/YeaQ/YmgE family stress response membrane protein [Rothia mucilaginosa]|uniref:GlsB/YeaQ/YmgE family stress response membrane protein n=1 Tax=Rothia mucilaginosa TaxID=43675 RepID=A0A930LBZ3_9MICC|nr:GlsB/YeaQ/YmgE family stress response membrane protein [Rothia mucilaginosa]MBF1663887.1 GlsB/YeaQ/YmgE family stress response membrane protein [Rothia mucilaginosa]